MTRRKKSLRRFTSAISYVTNLTLVDCTYWHTVLTCNIVNVMTVHTSSRFSLFSIQFNFFLVNYSRRRRESCRSITTTNTTPTCKLDSLSRLAPMLTTDGNNMRHFCNYVVPLLAAVSSLTQWWMRYYSTTASFHRIKSYVPFPPFPYSPTPDSYSIPSCRSVVSQSIGLHLKINSNMRQYK
jgi:hypothetical protein